jgi:hypothetical protein
MKHFPATRTRRSETLDHLSAEEGSQFDAMRKRSSHPLHYGREFFGGGTSPPSFFSQSNNLFFDNRTPHLRRKNPAITFEPKPHPRQKKAPRRFSAHLVGPQSAKKGLTDSSGSISGRILSFPRGILPNPKCETAFPNTA